MKKLLFDLLASQPVGKIKFHGGGEYIKRIFMHFIDMCHTYDIETYVFFNFDLYMDDYIIQKILEKKIESFDIKDINKLQNLINDKKFDIFYSGIPYFYGNVNFPNSIECIGTFHGFRSLEKYTDKNEIYYYEGLHVIKPLVKKILYPLKIKQIHKMYWNSIKKFRKIICDSKHTQYALRNFFPEVSNCEIRTYYAPAKYMNNFESNSIFDDEVSLYGKYILLIGANRWEKNGFRALKAIEGLFDKNFLSTYKVITVGNIPQKIKRKLQHKDKYIMFDYVEASKLETLYKHCDIFFYPSLNEGFGLPPFEAMKYGKTCIVSGVCSLPELCGESVYYVNPYDIEEMRARLLNAAVEKKDLKLVISKFNEISTKQENDLLNICNFIAEKNE